MLECKTKRGCPLIDNCASARLVDPGIGMWLNGPRSCPVLFKHYLEQRYDLDSINIARELGDLFVPPPGCIIIPTTKTRELVVTKYQFINIMWDDAPKFRSETASIPGIIISSFVRERIGYTKRYALDNIGMKLLYIPVDAPPIEKWERIT